MEFKIRRRIRRGVHLVIVQDGGSFTVCKETPGRNFRVLATRSSLDGAFSAFQRVLPAVENDSLSGMTQGALTMYCACGHEFGWCDWCANGLGVLVGEVCECCGAKGRKAPDPESIGERLERGEACVHCGEVTHTPKGIRPHGGFVCRVCWTWEDDSMPPRRGAKLCVA